MSASSGEPDDNGRLDSGRVNESPLSRRRLKHPPEMGPPPEPGEHPKSAAPGVETTPPPDQKIPTVMPWKRRQRRGEFAGDVAVAELRTRLSWAPDRMAEPRSPDSPARRSGGAWRSIGVIAVIVTGAVGYLWSRAPGTTPPSRQPAPVSARRALVQEPFVPASNRETPSPGLQVPGSQLPASPLPGPRPPGSRPVEAPPAASGLVPAAAAGTAREVTSGATQAPAATTTFRRADAAAIALMMKQGEQFMANADIAGARLIFQRAAESGDAAAALALAETYDPLVLGKSATRGGITPDIVAARTWYEKARELGSTVATERIARLASVVSETTAEQPQH